MNNADEIAKKTKSKSHSPQVSPKFDDQTCEGFLSSPPQRTSTEQTMMLQHKPHQATTVRKTFQRRHKASHTNRNYLSHGTGHTVLTETIQTLGFELPVFVNLLNVCPRNNKTILQENSFTVKTMLQPSPPSSCHPL